MIALKRNGSVYRFEPEAFFAWAREGGLLPSDEVFTKAGTWSPAARLSRLKPFLPAPSLGDEIVTWGVRAAIGLAAFKLAQALFDEDFGTRHYPEWYRREKIDEHLVNHGAYCVACDRRVRIADLTLDHIVPWAAGGLTSRQNARVICRRCNSSKRDRVGLVDHIRGRGN